MRSSPAPSTIPPAATVAGWRLAEVPVPYHPRTGRSKVTGTVRGSVRAIRDMGIVLRTLG